MIGQTISHYKILEHVGSGGMGDVWKAEDLKLGRHVALKFLASHLVSDPEIQKRFEREARAAASLDHPNICTIHEIDAADGKTFLAMSLVEGGSLEERIEKGPLPLNEALDIARQIAEGLQAAHAVGVVHRDIKPGNILLTPEGRVKILDFGLALLTEGSKLTKLDTTVGTVAYMSPEQAQGGEVDHRTDIWALGCLLYEMVAGQRPFQGHYDQALVYSIVNEDPEPLTALRTGVPMELEVFVGKCLAKDAADRYDSAAELAKDLRTLGEKLKSGRSKVLRPTDLSVPAVPALAGQPLDPVLAPPPSSLRIWQGLLAVVTLSLLGVLAFHFTQAPPEKPLIRFSFAPEGLDAATTSHVESISPDGRYILYVKQTDGESSLWLRSLGDEATRQVPGTTGAIGGFWSPDSASIGFQVGSELRRTSIDGGNPITLCKLPSLGYFAFRGGSWSPDGERIVFSSDVRLYEVAARGGNPRLLYEPPVGSPKLDAMYPRFLPADGGPPALVYTASHGPNDQNMAVLNLETGERRDLGRGNRVVYSRDGYLIHGSGGFAERGLWARPFSRETLEPSGDAFPISTDGFAPAVSNHGTLAYLDDAGAAALETLLWRNRLGERIESIGQPQPNINRPAISPDGNRIAVASDESGNRDIWVHDLIRSTKTRLTFTDRLEFWPAWSPSGQEIAYRLNTGGGATSLMRKAADGTGEAVALVEAEVGMSSPDWSRDGRYLLYTEHHPESTRADIRYLELQDDGGASEPVTFLATAANERNPRLSPNGRFLADSSDESGRDEIYVRPFPSGEGKWQVSVNGGGDARWRRDGGELYYVEGTTLMAVSVSTEQSFTLGQPHALFESSDLFRGWYDVSADGERFLMVAPLEEGEETAPPRIRVVQNWQEEFRDRE